jgi:hypothetical protein
MEHGDVSVAAHCQRGAVLGACADDRPPGPTLLGRVAGSRETVAHHLEPSHDKYQVKPDGAALRSAAESGSTGSRAPTEPAASQRYSHPMPSPSRSRSCASPCPSPAAMTTPGRTSARRCSPRSSARGRPTRLRDAAVAHFARYRRAAPTAGLRHRTEPGRYPQPMFGSSCHSDWTMRPQSGRSLSGRTGWAWRA